MGTEGAGADDTVVTRAVRLSSRRGRIEVRAEPREDVVVTVGGAEVARRRVDDGSPLEPVTVVTEHDRVVAQVPEGTDVVVGTMSGRVTLTGSFGAVAVTTTSGRVTIDDAATVRARTVSGRIEVGSCAGDARIGSVSGRVSVGRTGGVWATSKTARITVGSATGAIRARTVTGRIDVRAETVDVDARLESVSGRIEITVPSGVRPAHRFRSRRGAIRTSLTPGEDGEVAARTVAGSIVVQDG